MLKFDRDGLVPVVIQDDVTNEVLMVAFMNEEALLLTRETGQSHFFSRSRQKIWHKGEQSGNYQEVRSIHINCEENSLLVRVIQHGGATCHDGYKSCYYRQLLPDDQYKLTAERIFDPELVYKKEANQKPALPVDEQLQLETLLEDGLRRIYDVYVHLRDQDDYSQSNTSRMLHTKPVSFFVKRVKDELNELSGVLRGEHIHSGKQEDTALEGSQVGYWLFLTTMITRISYDEFLPHQALLEGYKAADYNDEYMQRWQEACIEDLSQVEISTVIKGLHLGFSIIGRACAAVGISPLAPIDYDLAQMRKKGLLS